MSSLYWDGECPKCHSEDMKVYRGEGLAECLQCGHEEYYLRPKKEVKKDD